MSIVHVAEREHRTVIVRETLEDERLTFAARGLLAYLLSKPDSWEVRVSHLIKASPAGRDHVYGLLHELAAFGYAVKEAERKQGKFKEWRWTIYERPLTAKPEMAPPDPAKPEVVGPFPAKPDPVNPEVDDITDNQLLRPFPAKPEVVTISGKTRSGKPGHPVITEKTGKVGGTCKGGSSEEGLVESCRGSGPRASARTHSQAKGSRLLDDWTLPDAWRQWAEAERPDLDIPKVGQAFRDYWLGAPGAKGRKADWLATWRNWVRAEDKPTMKKPKPGNGKAGQDEAYHQRQAEYLRESARACRGAI